LALDSIKLIIHPAVKQGLMLAYKAVDCTCLTELDVINLLVVSGMSEKQLLNPPA
jgi:hypothetical protein